MATPVSETLIRVGVIGLGVGEQHVIGYSSIPGVEVVAVCDIDRGRLDQVADCHGVAERHEDWRRVTEHPDIDIVSVCSFDDGHAEQCISAFNHGKHVMVEKPVVLYRHELDNVIRAQQDSGRQISSNLILRQCPRFKEVQQKVADGLYGQIFCIEGDYTHDILWKLTRGWRGKMAFYSTVFGGGIHLIDLMRWIVGAEIEEVCGMSNKILTHGSDYRFNDTFVNLLRFETSAMGKCLSTFGPARTKFHSLNVYGTERTFINGTPNAKEYDGDELENEHVIETPYPSIEKYDLIPDFVSAIRGGQTPDINHVDVFRVMDVCLAAVESVDKKCTIPVTYSI